jgi:hypothetical protein
MQSPVISRPKTPLPLGFETLVWTTPGMHVVMQRGPLPRGRRLSRSGGFAWPDDRVQVRTPGKADTVTRPSVIPCWSSVTSRAGISRRKMPPRPASYDLALVRSVSAVCVRIALIYAAMLADRLDRGGVAP